MYSNFLASVAFSNGNPGPTFPENALSVASGVDGVIDECGIEALKFRADAADRNALRAGHELEVRRMGQRRDYAADHLVHQDGNAGQRIRRRAGDQVDP